MPVRQEDRTTVNLGEDLIRAGRERAREEGREFNTLLAAALRAYLAGPVQRAEDSLPGLAPADPDPDLREDVRVLVAEVRRLLPLVASAAEGHSEVLDTLDEVVAELGRRRGAALALERAVAPSVSPTKPPGQR